MGIEKIRVRLGQKILNSCYVADRYFGFIGWFDYDDKILRINKDYRYIERLCELCIEHNVDYEFYDEKTEVVKNFYRMKSYQLQQVIEERNQLQKKLDEQLKYVPKKPKKVKNAEEKIKKRHS